MSFNPVAIGMSGLPLGSVPMVSLDLETTGLDTAKDRAIELAAVRLRLGEIADATFETFIDPGIPIPERSTAIHGISDQDIVGAVPFSQIMPNFATWAGTDVVIGYSIGFDLAILKGEHDRAGLAWSPPRALDVRQLVAVAAPRLPDQSMEVVAEWLGVGLEDRHRALGDAKSAARLLLALLPALREKGIATLGQAERACRELDSRENLSAGSGWHAVAINPDQLQKQVSEYARIDSFPYRHTVSELMNSPPETLSGEVPLEQGLKRMIEKSVSSVFLSPDDKGYAILTERDVMRAVAEQAGAALKTPIRDFAQGPLVTIDQDEFIYKATTLMADRGFRHLGVVDGQGILVGALSARDLLKQRAGDALSLGSAIENAESVAALGRVWSELVTVVRGLVHEHVDPRDIAAIISRELRALTKRACELALIEMAGEGLGQPPCDYAVLVLGSGGRGESLLAMDQDNAIVFAEGDPGGAQDQWFETLGRKMADILDHVGVCYCKGGIMASMPAWRKDIAHWREQLDQWLADARLEDIMNIDVFFDAKPVHGNERLAMDLMSEAQAAAAGERQFLKTMERDVAGFSSALNWRGRPKLKSGRVDLKMYGIMPIFQVARLLAVRHGIMAHSTPARLLQAKPSVPGFEGMIESLMSAHKILLGAILNQQLRDLRAGIPLANKVAPAEMDDHARQELYWAMGQIENVKSLVGDAAFMG
ncbi:DUF294 nucleotidyltransferase-like domain-containing protein [Aestuariispira insulae]|uniref:DNA polymerase-3 subunit epsilon/CBS domain-containing protein n=1 Tax=Aestuariispira insulae TaxID=1461337 RepID=A0A3D9H1J6_9PROT|nr:DUF294 nucleotidyltransferase-like domain-containing protein [Aestuariispira insulae]RED43364.1 DNA polymerase-3 subunit epsilon/CBS domain-containing protein [Aestuariispira insulae]